MTHSPSILIVDVETTGLDARTHEVVEFGFLLFRVQAGGHRTSVIDRYSGLRQPSHPIPSDVIRIHGLTDSVTQGHHLDDERIRHAFRNADVVVSHDAAFDYAFVSRSYPVSTWIPWLCSLRQSSWGQYGYSDKGLHALLQAHGISVPVQHRALADCESLFTLLCHPNALGQPYLWDLWQWAPKWLQERIFPLHETRTHGQTRQIPLPVR